LRYRQGGDDRQRNEGVPSGDGVPQRGAVVEDVASVNDAARGKTLSVVGVALALLRNYNPMQAPSTFNLTDLLQKFDKCFGATGRNYGKITGDRAFADI
jgi:hypothetical protein